MMAELRLRVAIRKYRLAYFVFRSLKTTWFCALSSVVEHYLHTVGVAGSKPAARTSFTEQIEESTEICTEFNQTFATYPEAGHAA